MNLKDNVDVFIMIICLIMLFGGDIKSKLEELKLENKYKKYREYSIYMSNLLINHKILEISFLEFYEYFCCSRMKFLSEKFDCETKYIVEKDSNVTIWLHLNKSMIKAEILNISDKTKYGSANYIILLNNKDEYDMYLAFYEESKTMKHKIQNKAEIEDVFKLTHKDIDIINDPDLKKAIMYNQKKKELGDKIIEKYGSDEDKEKAKHIVTPRRGYSLADLYDYYKAKET